MSHSAKPNIAAVTPYERGVEHLKRSENAEAVAAFTEAIGLEPEAPNAYVGRALAYRSLGDEAAALRDEQTTRALGGPERCAWDRLVKRAHRNWRVDLRDPAWANEDPLSRDAYLLRQWTWQIYNGGLPQWIANGFGEWTDDLARAVERVGTGSARTVAAIVRDLATVLAGWPGAREVMSRMLATRSRVAGREEELFGELMRCEDRYYRAGRYPGEFVTDVEAWLERESEEALSGHGKLGR
jgi:hypothetical protein